MYYRAFIIALSFVLCLLGVDGASAEARESKIAPGGRLPLVDLLPVGSDDVWAVGDGSGVDRQATVVGVSSGGFIMVYSEFQNGDMDSARLKLLVSNDGKALSSPITLAFDGKVEDAPALIDSTDGTWLYFASSTPSLSNIMLWRAPVADGIIGSPQPLPDIDGLNKLIQWPRWVSAGDDVLVTFRGRGAGPSWARLDGGITPKTPVLLGSENVAYPRVVPMRGGGCFYSYQRPPKGGYMATWYRVSPDCASWSPPIELSRPRPSNKPDVHDAYALPRVDEGVDVYYVYPSFKGKDAKFPVGFDLYRRSVMTDGQVGPEELLTERIQFYPFSPSAHRLPDGTILVSFSDIQEYGKNGVARARITLFKVATDAPSPE